MISHTISKIKFLLSACLILTSLNLSAQKLPGKQTESVRAPQAVKIDGKATEWTFKAYNNATDVFYTVAHDDDNIYLVIKAEDESIVRKIMSGGITFTINSVGGKAETAAAITYPVLDYKTKPHIVFSSRDIPKDSIEIIAAANTRNFKAQAKFAKTTGMANVDTNLSVYNTAGIMLASSFDNKLHYTFELAVPRKLVHQAVGGDGKFAYKVLLNAIQIGDIPGVDIKRDDNGNVIGVNIQKALSSKLSQSAQLPTDFSGEYVLTTK